MAAAPIDSRRASRRLSRRLSRPMDARASRRPSLVDQTEAMLEFGRKFSAYGPLAVTPEMETDEVTAAGHIGSTVEEVADPDYFRRWLSLSIVFLITFLLSVQNTIYWNSLFPFLTEIDPTASESFFGVCIMIFNLGSTLASPLFGYWTNRIGQCKIPIIAGIVMTILGNILLIFVEAFTSNRKWILMVARFISGIGVGNYGSLYAYVVMGSTLKERNKALSLRAAINSAAIMTGPALQTAFVPIGYPGYVWGPFHINTYTSPAITNIILGVIQIVILLTIFKEYWVGVAEIEGSSGSSDESDNEDAGPKVTLKPYDKVAAGVCIWTRLTQMFCLAYDNTIGSPLTMAMLGWNASEAVLYNGIILIVSASCDFCGNLIMGNFILRYVQERNAILLGISIFIFFFIISFPWPGLPPIIAASTEIAAAGFENVTTTLASVTGNGTTPVSAPGCTYVWCSYTTRINLPQYLVAYACLVLSVSIAFTPNATLFSKVLGPRKQGTLQGLFAASGQLAMTIAPIVVSTVFDYGGPRITNVIGGAVLILTVAMNAIFYKRLVPWTDDDDDDGDAGEKEPLLDYHRNSSAHPDYYTLPEEPEQKEEVEV